MEIDIRNSRSGTNDVIRFADIDKFVTDKAAFIERQNEDFAFQMYAWDTSVGVHKSDVENLIKALQKAVELGWTK